ncbi:MAG: alpha-1,2-fucosyltransferase [Verrucomicrobiota bacterium]
MISGSEEKPLYMQEDVFAAEMKQARHLVVDTWYAYMHPKTISQYAPDIRRRLALRVSQKDKDYTQAIRSNNNKILVGIHIRHGDFAEYQDGKFFYSFRQYAQMALELQRHESNHDIAFLICCNEAIPEGVFKGIEWFPGPGTLTGDLHALSQCDFIMGPPSTYNTWASFIGDVPRYELKEGTDTPRLNAFKREHPLGYPYPYTMT